MTKIKEQKLLNNKDLAKRFSSPASITPQQVYEQMDKQNDVYSPDEATAKAISELTSTKNIEALSHFSDAEIKQLSFMHTLAKEYHIDVINTYIEKFGRFRISLNRRGRGEIVDVSKEKKSSGFPMNFGKLNRL